MAIELATAYVSLTASAKGISKSISSELEGPLAKSGGKAGEGASKEFGSKLKSGVGKAGDSAGKDAGAKMAKGFGGSLKSGLSGLGSAGLFNPALLGLAAVGTATKFAVSAASDLQEATSKSDAVFRENAKTVQAWAGTASRAFGQSKAQALEAAGTFGNLFQAFGVGLEPATEMSVTLTELASDLASFNNTSVQEAIEALRSGLSGETEPLKRYGVALTDVRLKQEAFGLGLIKSIKSPMDAAAKSQAAYSLIMKDTALAQGDFARTADGYANSMKTLQAVVTDSAAAIGAAILPMLAKIIKGVADGITWLDKLGVKIQDFEKATGTGSGGSGGLAGWAGDLVGLDLDFKWGKDLADLSWKEFVFGADEAAAASGRVTESFNHLEAAKSRGFAASQRLNAAAAQEIAVSAGMVAAKGREQAANALVADSIERQNAALAANVIAQLAAIDASFAETAANNAFTTAVEAANAASDDLTTGVNEQQVAIDGATQAALAAALATNKLADDQMLATTGAIDAKKSQENLIGTLMTLASRSSGPVAAAIGLVITKLQDVAKQKPKPPIDVEDRARPKIDDTKAKLAAFNGSSARASLDLDTSRFSAALSNAYDRLRNLRLQSVGTFGLAGGVRNWRGGWTMVGEEGPELVNLPRGSDVYTAAETQGMVGAGTGVMPAVQAIVITGNTFIGDGPSITKLLSAKITEGRRGRRHVPRLMTLAYRSSGAFVDANSTSSGAVGLPAGLANGDVLVLVCQSRGTGGTVATPAGYTQAATPTRSASHRLTVFYKYVPTAGAEVAPTVTQTVSGAIRCRLTALSGGSATTVLDVVAVTDDGPAELTVTAPSITPVSSGAMVIWVFSAADDVTLNAATAGTTAYSSDGTAGTDGSIALVYELQGSPAASGVCAMTESVNGPDNWIAVTLALRPAAVAATVPATALFDDILFDVDVAFGAGPFTPNPTWTRVTDYLSGAHAVTIDTGRADEDEAVNPGTCRLVLNNSITGDPGRRFDPDYAAGPYYGQLNLRTPIRIWARRDSVTHPLFTGLVQSWRQIQVAGSRDGLTEVSAVDVSSLLANTPVPATALHLAVLTDDPEVYVPMDEEQLGPVVDASGNGWIGTYPRSVTIPDTIIRAQAGKKAKARTLVGNVGVDGTIANMTANTAPENIRALEAWVKVDAYDPAVAYVGVVHAVDITAYGVSSGLRLAAVISQSSMSVQTQWWAYIVDAAETFTVGWSADFTMSAAHHIALVVDDAFQTATLYLDGQPAGASGISGLTLEGGSMTPALSVNIASDESSATVAHVAAYAGTLTDAEVLRHYEAGLIGGHLQTAAERLDILAEYAGLIDAELWDSSLMGTHTFLAAADFSGSVLDEMRTIIQADQGRMFVDGMGILTAQSRITDIAPGETEHVTSQGTYGDSAPSEIRYEDWHREPATEALLRNVITVNGTQVRDTASWSLYGPADEDFTLPFATPGAARAFAQSRIAKYATPQPRLDALTVNLRGHLDAELDTAQNTTLGLRLGHRITATIRPANGLGDDVVENVRVEGRHDEITRHGWVTDLYTVPAGDAYNEGPFWTLGHATYGRIGTPAGNMIPG